MRLSDAEILRLLPAFMRKDPAVQGLAEGTDPHVRDLDAKAKHLTRWDKIDDMDHAELDEIAWEENVFWYDSTASLEVKRAMVRNALAVFSRLGTKWAVEQVVADYFGSGQVWEWFEYGGAPHHFKIIVDNPEISLDNYKRFLELLYYVKRKSSWLDTIIINLTVDTGHIYLGAGQGLGQTLTIHPWQPEPIDSRGAVYIGAGMSTAQELSIQPKEA